MKSRITTIIKEEVGKVNVFFGDKSKGEHPWILFDHEPTEQDIMERHQNWFSRIKPEYRVDLKYALGIPDQDGFKVYLFGDRDEFENFKSRQRFKPEVLKTYNFV